MFSKGIKLSCTSQYIYIYIFIYIELFIIASALLLKFYSMFPRPEHCSSLALLHANAYKTILIESKLRKVIYQLSQLIAGRCQRLVHSGETKYADLFSGNIKNSFIYRASIYT